MQNNAGKCSEMTENERFAFEAGFWVGGTVGLAYAAILMWVG